MADRYFVDAPIAGPVARLTGGEAHHLAHVLRAKPGDEVTLFDGGGFEFSARVERIGRSEIELAVLSRADVDRALLARLTLGVALPKGDRQRWLVEKATELGVARLVPLQTERSNDRESTAGLDKLRRAVIEASKQCGRNRLLEIAPPEALESFLSRVEGQAVRLIAHPGGQSCGNALDQQLADPTQPLSVALAIGPEGGFIESEIERAVSLGWQTVDLGPRVLRVETAALCLVSAIACRLS